MAWRFEVDMVVTPAEAPVEPVTVVELSKIRVAETPVESETLLIDETISYNFV